MDVKVGPHWYRNSDGIIEIEGLPQIELLLRKPEGPLGVNFAIFDSGGKLHAKVERSSMVINEQGAYDLVKSDKRFLLTKKDSGKTVLDLHLKDEGHIEIPQGEFYTLKGHLLTITQKEWSIEKLKGKEGESDMKGKAVAVASE
ncbi:MAG: hypothetical protein NPIRA02_29120 [Nitrospirales bacterium]|nr:MAG: hypothetical protein NPIRA02_29120 [Nitrospirales bacterium]